MFEWSWKEECDESGWYWRETEKEEGFIDVEWDYY